HQGALNPPIYWSSTYAFDSAEQGAARFAGEEPGMIYSRVTNPTVANLEERLASLENGEVAVAFGSGMGAITSLMWTTLRPGDELLVDLTLYGCTHSLVHHLLPQFGIVVKAADFTDPANLGEHLNERTKLVFFETPANPNMRLVDIAAVSALVHRLSPALVAVDNTYCTPYLQRPLDLGADLVVHSLTKYINGHGDVIAGAAVGRREIIDPMRWVGIKEMTGACLSPMDAYLVLRGLKTLPIRMDRHCQSAGAIAEFLEQHPAVARVDYPGLASHPQFDLAQRQMAQPGAMIAFELKGGLEAGRRFINALGLVTRAVSLGDAESLAQHPASMTHSSYAPEERERHMLSDGLVRLSVGLEDVDDLIADVSQALVAAG
ncbi:MAG: aminotransferase class I/II-fold pyridoxal phosphate-dependent enzyme, partial [Hydrogenophilaceae bacterium]